MIQAPDIFDSYDKFTIAPKPPFDLAYGARFFASRSFQPLNRPKLESGSDGSVSAARLLTFHSAINGAGIEIKVAQRQAGNGKLAVAWREVPWVKQNGVDSESVTSVTRSDVRELVRKVFSLDLDLQPFYKKAKSIPQLAKPFSNAPGFKPVLATSVYDAALWAIAGQQVTFTFARTLKQRLHERYGQALQTSGGPLPLTPRPEKLANARVSALRKLQLSESKANYIVNLSRAIVKGELDLESLASKPYEAAVEELVSFKGIGVWSANYILMRGAGHRDALPLGDAGLKRAARTAYDLEESPTPEMIEEFAAPFRPYRSLYTMYLWQTLD